MMLLKSYIPASFNDCRFTNGMPASDDDVKHYYANFAQRTQFYFTFTSISTIVFSTVGFSVNLIFTLGVIRGLRRKILSYQNYYFLLNRALCDLIACFASGVTILGVILHIFTSKTSAIVFTLSCTPYFVNFATIISLSLLKLLAVKKPIFYRVHITKRVCLYAIAGTWLIGIADQIFNIFILLPLLDFGPNFLCNSTEACAKVGQYFWISVTLTSYFLVIFVLLITCYYVVKSQRQSKKSLWKLAVINGAFIALNCLEAPGGYVLFGNYPIFLQSTHTATCVILSDDEVMHFQRALIFLSVWYLIIIGRMLVDPLTTIVIDEKMRKILIDMWKTCLGYSKRALAAVAALPLVALK